MTKRRILLVDDEITVLLTLKAVLEISGFEVDTAASAKEGKSRIAKREYDMIITDMRMESDAAGVEVIKAARMAPYHPAVALLTAFPISDEDQLSAGADKMLIKPMQTRILLQQIDRLLASHETKLAKVTKTTKTTEPAVAANALPAKKVGKLSLVSASTEKKPKLVKNGKTKVKT